MGAGALAEYRTPITGQEQGHIALSVEEYNRLITEKVRLEYELEQARQQLIERKTAETITAEILTEIKRFVTDSDTKKPKEIQIPTFVNNRNRR